MKHDKKKQWLSIGLLTLGAAALAVFAAATLDAGDVRASLAALLPGWTAAIVGCMLLYYLCDALKYQLITRAFGCAQPLGDSIDTSMIGFFYSAVTPAAAGGQPFQVLHMHRRGIPTGTATSVICTTYCLWNVALVTLGIVGMCLCGGKLALALGQCTAYMSVAYCTYRGFGLHGVPFWQVTGTQVLLYIGASCFPMPGASGASEGTFYLAFSPLFGDYLTTAMLIWRLASYYLTIVLGYIAVVAERVTLRRAEE